MTQERRNLARTEGLRPSLVAICRDGSATAEAVIKCITEGDNPNAIQKNKISPGLGNSSRNEWTPIQLASISCPASVVAALAGSGAKISLDSSELVLAALNNDHDGVIPSLIRAGANPDASDHQGETVLSRVIRLARSNEELDRLVRNPCHLPTLDPKTLEIAYEARSSVSLVRNLLSAALPISNSGSSSLLERITWDFEEDRSGRRNSYLVALFNVLISHKFITDSSTSSPLELAIARVTSTHLFLQSVLTKRTNQEDPEIFKDLLWRILDSVDDDNGDRSGPIKSIQAAIVSGCNRTIPNAAGDTPLHCACEKFASEDIADLLACRENVDLRNRLGKTALHLAVTHAENPDLVKLLLSRGASVRARDHTGQTPLHSLCESCRTVDDAVHYIDAAYLLLDNGADQNDIDDQGQTPYDTLSLNVRHTEFGEIVSD